jgi:hypothetical protein
MWSPTEIEELKELTKTETVNNIVKKLNRTDNEVRWKIRRLGLRTTVPWQRERKKIIAIFTYSEKFGCKNAAKKFRLSLTAIKSLRQRHKAKEKKNSKGVSGNSLIKLRKVAIRYAMTKGRSFEDAQEFASYVIIKKIEVGKSVNLFFLYINWNEGEGRKRYDKIYDESENDDDRMNKVCVGVEQKNDMGWMDSISSLNQINRAIVILFVKFGLRMHEIAVVFNLTESRISQIFSEVSELIRDKI